ncbi:hypothetical protein AN478_11700 [Thiohalorhabdus denitrificans]|uniref:Transmembrane protein n=1 Tax=Thiohalorhabdus denitrificans TaxID=381306 RepID=A0A0P9CRU6_9GAMM|nr:DUF6776 family protein [Thiohalorhabdus denitrificans]KPV39380.1 hypothetical protein AN478_11700 [Thiohalorhabdus denitrificans]SCY67070.1 hypothetical protein SAMN05661077_0094 [Thiohalorhabdus denitrificans]
MDQRYASLVLLLHPNRGRPRTLYIRRVVFFALVALLVLGLPGSLWGAFQLGMIWRAHSTDRLEARVESLEHQKGNMEDTIRELRSRAAQFESDKARQSGQLEKLRQVLNGLETRNNNLQDQVAFYRSILDPDKAHRDTSVRDFRVHRVDGPGRSYGYSFRLIQGIGKKEPVRGYARVVVTFLNGDGEEETRFFPEGAEHRKRGMDAEFRYFQNFRGRIQLPEKAQPIRATVQLYDRNSLGELLSQAHDWDRLVQVKEKEDGDDSQET